MRSKLKWEILQDMLIVMTRVCEFRQWSCGPISTFVVTETCEMHCPFLVSITTDLQAFAEKKRNACTCNNKRNAF